MKEALLGLNSGNESSGFSGSGPAYSGTSKNGPYVAVGVYDQLRPRRERRRKRKNSRPTNLRPAQTANVPSARGARDVRQESVLNSSDKIAGWAAETRDRCGSRWFVLFCAREICPRDDGGWRGRIGHRPCSPFANWKDPLVFACNCPRKRCLRHVWGVRRRDSPPCP